MRTTGLRFVGFWPLALEPSSEWARPLDRSMTLLLFLRRAAKQGRRCRDCSVS